MRHKFLPISGILVLWQDAHWLVETSNLGYTQPGNSEHLSFYSCKLNSLEEVFVEIVQKVFPFVSFCLIPYVLLHSGTVWTVLKLLSPSQNRTGNSGSFICTVLSKPNPAQSAASFSMSEHDERTYPGEASELQMTCGAWVRCTAQGQDPLRHLLGPLPTKAEILCKHRIEETNIWRKPDSVIHFLRYVWRSSLPSPSAVYAFSLLILQCKKKGLTSSSRVLLSQGRRTLRCSPLTQLFPIFTPSCWVVSLVAYRV